MQSTYGLRLLRSGRTEPERTLSEVSDYVAHLPHGCALWVDVGGALALSDDAHLLREAVFRLEELVWQNSDGKGKKPERIPLPRSAAEARAEAIAMQNRLAEKARRYARGAQRRSAATT